MGRCLSGEAINYSRQVESAETRRRGCPGSHNTSPRSLILPASMNGMQGSLDLLLDTHIFATAIDRCG